MADEIYCMVTVPFSTAGKSETYKYVQPIYDIGNSYKKNLNWVELSIKTIEFSQRLPLSL